MPEIAVVEEIGPCDLSEEFKDKVKREMDLKKQYTRIRRRSMASGPIKNALV